MRELLRPPVPAFQSQVSPQTVEQDKVVEPPPRICTEALETGARCGSGRAQKFVSGFEKQRHFAGENALVVNWADSVTHAVKIGAIQPSVLNQALQADQQWISSEGRG